MVTKEQRPDDGSLYVPPPSVTLEPGATFAREYVIVRPLGAGGMGAVYEVNHAATGRHRALKIMHRDFVRDRRLHERFQQEAKIGGQIGSDHVVEVLAAGVEESSSTPWLIMELLEGEDLDRRVERCGAISLKETREIFAQLCHALSLAHAKRIVHRDLKPDNIFLAISRREGAVLTVKVLDFGIAKVMAEARSGTSTATIGTPWWMAPEQTMPGALISPATDVWALGLIAFYLITGRAYWLGANTEGASPLMAIREVALEPLEVASARAARFGTDNLLPQGFDAWFARCVARDPKTRFATAAELRDSLLALLDRACESDAVGSPPEKPRSAGASGLLPRTVPAAPIFVTPTHEQTQQAAVEDLAEAVRTSLSSGAFESVEQPIGLEPVSPLLDFRIPTGPLADEDVSYLQAIQYAKRTDKDLNLAPSWKIKAWSAVVNHARNNDVQEVAEGRISAWRRLLASQKARSEQLVRVRARYAEHVEKLDRLLNLDNDVLDQEGKASVIKEFIHAYAAWDAELDSTLIARSRMQPPKPIQRPVGAVSSTVFRDPRSQSRAGSPLATLSPVLVAIAIVFLCLLVIVAVKNR